MYKLYLDYSYNNQDIEKELKDYVFETIEEARRERTRIEEVIQKTFGIEIKVVIKIED